MSTFTPDELTYLVPPFAFEVARFINPYGEVAAVGGVPFTVAATEVVGFLGSNGVGKNTTINVLCTLARWASGTADASGFDVVACGRYDVRRRISLIEALKAIVGAGLATARSGTVAAAVGGCGALAGTGAMTAGVWR